MWVARARRTLAVVFICAGMALPAGSGAQPAPADGHLRFAAPMFPPYYAEDQNGRFIGTLFDLFDLLCVEAGLTWTGSVSPAPRMLQLLVDDKADAALLVGNPTLRANAYLQSPRPLTELVLNVYRRTATPPVTTRDGLRGRTITLMRGFAYGGLRSFLSEGDGREGTLLHDMNGEDMVVRFLEAGRADYALLYDVNFVSAVRILGRRPPDVTFDTLSRIPAYLYLNGETLQDAPALMVRFMEAHDRLLAKGLVAPVAGGS